MRIFTTIFFSIIIVLLSLFWNADISTTVLLFAVMILAMFKLSRNRSR